MKHYIGLTIKELDDVMIEAGFTNGAMADAPTTRSFISKAIEANNKRLLEEVRTLISGN